MCYRPIRIKNPKIESEHSDLDATIDKLYITVPCGHCGECRQHKQDDIYLRTNAEFNMIHPSENIHNGFVMFNTLTYNEDSVPYFHGLRCFDGNHITNFIKRLRSHLVRDFGLDGSDLHFLIVSEYGSDTARPHYHPLFFVQDHGKIIPQQFGELVEQQWPYGFVQTSNPYDPKYYKNYDECIVKDQSGCIKYVSKYCVKDFDFLYVLNRQRPPEFIEYLVQQLSLIGKDIDLTDIDYHVLYSILDRSDYRRFMPFQRMSQHFGESLVNYDYKSLVNGYIMLPDKEKGQKAYRVPQYIERKLFYDYDKTTKLYTLNDKGKDMKVKRLSNNRCYVYESTIRILYGWHMFIDTYRQDSVLSYLRDHVNSELYSYSDVTDYIQELLDGRSLDQYITYILLYKDYIKPIHTDIYPDIGVDSYVVTRLNYDSPSRILSKRQCNDFLKNMELRCNSCYEFRYFDELYKLYDILRSKIGCYKQSDYLFEQRQKSQTKYINTLYYGKL